MERSGTAMSLPRVMVALNTPSLATCSVKVLKASADAVTVRYDGLPANQPGMYGNILAIWEASMVPWTAPPIKKITIGDNGQSGTQVIDGLTITRNSYIVGYGTGPEIGSICCSAVVSAGGLLAAPTNASIGLENIGTSSLAIHYQTLGGYRPQRYKNWIGLWKGFASPYNGDTPVARVEINSDANEGSIGLNNVALGINSNYTLIYFSGEAQTTAAAILTFNTTEDINQSFT